MPFKGCVGAYNTSLTHSLGSGSQEWGMPPAQRKSRNETNCLQDLSAAAMDLHIFARALLAQTQRGTSGDSACTLAVHVNVADCVFTTAIANDACLIVIQALQNQVSRTILGT